MKNKVRSKVLIFMLCLILSGMAMLGCSNGSEEIGNVPELASVSFGVMDGSEKVISISRDAPGYETLYWSYTAEWKGDAGVIPAGAQSEKKAVKDGAGLAELGGFTPGSWGFGLFGYSDSERTELVLSGTSEVELLAGEKTDVTVFVDYNNITGTGTIELGEITFKEGTGSEYTLVSITVDDDTEQITNLSDNQLTGIAAGSHTVYLKYSGDGGYYEANVKVTVSAGVTTVIKGQLDLLVAAAPKTLKGEPPTTAGGGDGKITGLVAGKTYQYSKDGGSTWTDVAAASSEITNLAADMYKVRVSGVRPGDAVEVKVPARYKVTFYANGGSETMDSGSVVEGETYTIPLCTFTAPAFEAKTGAVSAKHQNLAGWKTAENGDGKVYKAGGTIPKEDITENITLYAQWANPSFSVSSNKKVYFSKGNLQAVFESPGKTRKWSFAENQYDIIGNSGANIKISGLGEVSESGTVDLFAWSINLTDYGILPEGYKFSGITTSAKFIDWGNIASLPGNSSETKVWSTLSYLQWNYLLAIRTGATVGETENARYAKVRINNINGLLIFPDTFTWDNTMGNIPNNINDSKAGYNSYYNINQFTAMQNAGVAFLPEGGYKSRSDSEVKVVCGYYWANGSLNSEYKAPRIYFNKTDLITNGLFELNYGLSVRLVCSE